MLNPKQTALSGASARLQRSSHTPPRVLSYDRVSGSSQVEGRGLGRQKDAAEKWCQDHNLTLDTKLVFSDPGRSASKGKHLADDAALGRLLWLVNRGQIEPGTILLVEAIDRLSRLDVMTGLKRIIFALIEGGIRIITLEDNCEYSIESIENDWTKVLTLVVRVQAAYEYTKRLRDRVIDSWEQSRKNLDQGILDRPNLFCPEWCDVVGGKHVLNYKADVVRLVFELLKTRGTHTVARYLNENKIPTLTGAKWTGSNVHRLAVRSDSVFGSIVHHADWRGLASREARNQRGMKQQCYENMLPACVDKDEVLQVRQLIESRKRTRTGINATDKQVQWIGAGITFCSCGSLMTTCSTRNRSGKLFRYVRCIDSLSKKGTCNAKAYPLRPLMAHVLTRLKPENIRELLGDDSNQNNQRQIAIDELEKVTQELELAKTRASNSSSALEKAILEGWDLGDFQRVLHSSREWVATCEDRLVAARRCVDAYSNSCELSDLDSPVRSLLLSFASGEETAKQRMNLNQCMRRLKMKIIAPSNHKKIGISIDDGQVYSEPFDPDLAEEVLINSLFNVSYLETLSGLTVAVEQIV